MKLAIASDHAGLELKKKLLQFLQSQPLDVLDLGVNSDASVDYPDIASQVAEAVSTNQVQGGILVCGTGIGMAMTANKFKGVRAAVITDLFTAEMSKRHNNANVIALGGRVLTAEKAQAMVDAWLKSKYEDGRHNRRLEKIHEIEEKNFK